MAFNLNPRQTFKLSIDKILFIFACTYLMMIIFWLVSQGKLKLPGIANSSGQATDQKSTISPQDAKFIAYLQQSLEKLESKRQQQTTNSQPTSKVIPPQTVKVPPAPIPSPPATPSTTPQVIERIYVPVYPQMQQPNVAVNSAPPVIAIKPPSPTRLNVPPPPPLPVRSPSTIQPLPSPSSVPVLTPGATLVPEKPPSIASTNTTNTTNINRPMLVGLLEAGDQSSALFTINGQTQRIQLGEGIGTTGWMLKSIQNQQAVITRNSTIRYLGVGQNF